MAQPNTADELSRIYSKYQIMDDVMEGCQVISPDYFYVYVNKAICKQGHHKKHELLGHTMMEMYPGIDKTEVFVCLRACLKQQTQQSLDNEFIYPDGTKGWFILRMEPVEEGVLIFSFDITDRKNAEAAVLDISTDLEDEKTRLQEAKLKDEAILESIGDGVIATDKNGKVTFMNKVAERLFDWSLNEALGKPFVKVATIIEDVDGNIVSLIQRPLNQAITHGKKTSAQYYYTRRDKKKFAVAVTVTPIILDNDIIGVIEICRDITKEKEVDRAKSEFVSLASHQLRTPLGISKWYLEAIRKDEYATHAPEIFLHYLEEVYANTERVLAVVRDLLSVSRIDQDRVRNDPKETDIIKLVQDIFKAMRLIAAKKDIKLKLVIKKKRFPKIFIDCLRLQEVIENLLTNALEYTLPSGVVTIVVDTAAHDGILIDIIDTGMGISEYDQKKLFTKFFRSEKGAMQNTEGSGLGLYVVKSYVEGWGGTVRVKSQEGKGSTFSISIPIEKQAKRKEVG